MFFYGELLQVPTTYPVVKHISEMVALSDGTLQEVMEGIDDVRSLKANRAIGSVRDI
jgi:hypothetical protein